VLVNNMCLKTCNAYVHERMHDVLYVSCFYSTKLQKNCSIGFTASSHKYFICSNYQTLHLLDVMFFSMYFFCSLQESNGGLESSWLTGTSLLDRESLCNTTYPTSVISISRDELLAMQSKLAEQEQTIAILNAKVEKTLSGLSSSNEKSVNAVIDLENVHNVNCGEITSAQPLGATVDVVHTSLLKTIDSCDDSKSSLHCELLLARDSEQRLQNQLTELKKEVDEMSTRLRHADNTISVLKRHIELNSAPDNASSPALNPDIIVALALEVERLNSELEKYRIEQSQVGGSEEENQQDVMVQGREHVKSAAKRRSGIPVRTLHNQRNISHSINGLQTKNVDVTCSTEDVRRRSFSIGSITQRSYAAEQLCVDRNPSLIDRAVSSLPALYSVDDDYKLSLPAVITEAQRKSVGDELNSVSILPSHDMSALEYLPQTCLDGSSASQTPFNTISIANKRAFSELQSEVERLKKRVEQTELENSRLMELSRRETLTLSFLGGSEQKPEREGAADGLHCFDVQSPESGQVVVSAGFLKKLVEVNNTSVLASFCCDSVNVVRLCALIISLHQNMLYSTSYSFCSFLFSHIIKITLQLINQYCALTQRMSESLHHNYTVKVLLIALSLI